MSENQPGQPASGSPQDDATRTDREDQEGVAAAPFLLSQEPVTEPDSSHGGTPDPTAPPAPAYEHLGELPATYGTQSVYLVAYDPRQLFAYWDVDWAAAPGAAFVLRACRADGEVESEQPITAVDAGRYLPAAVPGGTYFAELGTRGRDGAWNPVATSARVTMPSEGLASEAEPKFATLPFHLSFQRLLELIQGAMGNKEDLTAALARLQHGDRAWMRPIAGALEGMGSEKLHTLESLLGHEFSVHSAGDTGSGGHLRDRVEARGAGAYGNEGLSSGDLARGAGGSEGLSSAGMFGPRHGGGSEGLSSGGFGRDMTLAAFVAGMNSESLASFMGPGGGSEAWRLAKVVGPGGSDLAASERAADFRRAIEHQIGLLGALFSGSGSGDGSGPSSPGR